MNLSSVPPRASISRFTAAWNGTSRALTSSGSARSELEVNPTRSQNRTVTTRRSSAGGGTSSCEPQNPQYRKPSAFSRPQEGQTTAGRVYGQVL
jgi:hypothetical protein